MPQRRYRKEERATSVVPVLPAPFFPKAAISLFTKAGLLTCFTFCGLPVCYGQWRGLQKAF